MTNPSTVWTQLAMPNPAMSSIPFVATDNASIITDVLNFNYTSGLAPLTGTNAAFQLTAAGGVRYSYLDLSAAPAVAVTVNKTAGRIAIPAGSRTVVVTCPGYAFPSSFIQCQIETQDATLTSVIPIPALGSFQIQGNANATGIVKVSYVVDNVF